MSRFIAEIYGLAQQLTPDNFPAAVLRQLRPLLSFDDAHWGTFDSRAGDALALATALPGPLAFCDDDPRYAELLRQLRIGHDEWHARRLILIGDAPPQTGLARWLILYRCTPHDFRMRDRLLLQAVWSHMRRAFDWNLHRTLNESHARNGRALGLVNVQNLIETADPGFHDMLRIEWPGTFTVKLPARPFDQLMRELRYPGERIEISATRRHGYLLCTARRHPMSRLLTPMERNVAERFATGKACKEIARELGTSPNTVRNQISRLYRKLDVHDKAALASLLLRDC